MTNSIQKISKAKPKPYKVVHWPCTKCKLGELKLYYQARKLTEPVLTG
ncbi:hypothetical protein [Catenovulum adriaticum]|uniref:Uncharacterized protein n=1 Tax=Catenovulum adriaticum TaxID=2984846 RepID=A0ABY7AQ32_9ALTE|nr:hypothetical protein [Catenovulum sp. TS8]WAJ70857.1 hypothetical protein OLW01_03335 [Catenovulum sp. TS8]